MTARPLAEAPAPPVETERQIYRMRQERRPASIVHRSKRFAGRNLNVSDDAKDDRKKVPPPTLSDQPEEEIEELSQKVVAQVHKATGGVLRS